MDNGGLYFEGYNVLLHITNFKCFFIASSAYDDHFKKVVPLLVILDKFYFI